MEQFNGVPDSGHIAIPIHSNNEGSPPPSTAGRGHQSSPTPPHVELTRKEDPPQPPASPRASPTPTLALEKPKPENKFLSTTAKLGYFLPTGITMLFETVVPKIYRNGQCSGPGTIMMWIVLGLCVIICFLSQFTDSKTSVDAKDGKKKVEYEFVKPSSWEFKDGVHALTSVVAFLVIAFSDQRVVGCVLPAHVKDFEEVMPSLEIMVLSVCSFLYLVFPISRSGLVPKLAYDGLELKEDNKAD